MKKLLAGATALCLLVVCANFAQAAALQQGFEDVISVDGTPVGRPADTFYQFGGFNDTEGWWTDGAGVQFNFKYDGQKAVPFTGGFASSSKTTWPDEIGGTRFVSYTGAFDKPGAAFGDGYGIGYVATGFNTTMDFSSAFAFDDLLKLTVAPTIETAVYDGTLQLVIEGYDAAGVSTGEVSIVLAAAGDPVVGWIDVDLRSEFTSATERFGFTFQDGAGAAVVGQSFAVDYQIPEPGTYAMLCGLGLVGAAWYRRRRNAK